MPKIKLKPIVKYHEGDKYIFINGVAEVPGLRFGKPNGWYQPKPTTVTLKEFLQLTKGEAQ